jgi:hypothetical protein
MIADGALRWHILAGPSNRGQGVLTIGGVGGQVPLLALAAPPAPAFVAAQAARAKGVLVVAVVRVGLFRAVAGHRQPRGHVEKSVGAEYVDHASVAALEVEGLGVAHGEWVGVVRIGELGSER